MTAVGVVARGDEVAAARVLARSLGDFHPDWRIHVVVLPGVRPELHPERELFVALTPAELAAPALERLLMAAPPAELAGLLRPLLAAHLLERGAERVLVLAPDAEAHGPLGELVAGLESHRAVLVPRLTGVLPDDGARPDGRDLLEAGTIDDALVAVRGDEAGRALVAWWTERALEAAEASAALSAAGPAPEHLRLAASPLDAAPSVFEDVERLEDPGYGVSYWNLHERRLGGDADAPTAAGRPLRVMRWAGFRPDRPWWLSEHGSRALVLDDPVLAELVSRRVSALRDAGWLRPEDLDTAGGDLPGGLRYDTLLRGLHAEAEDAGEDFGDVYSPAGAEAFTAWLTEPGPAGGAQGVNRYAHAAWRERADVRGAYPDLDGADAEGFLGWLWVHGRPELKLQEALLPAPPASIDAPARHIPPVLVTGYLRGTLGLGQAARGYTRALEAAGVPVATHTVAADPPVERLPRGSARRPEETAFAELALPEGIEPEINLVCVNADQLPGFVEELGDELSGRYTIGQWAWETSHVPERWDSAFDLVDELWVYSTYVAEHISRSGDVPVVVMPLPVEAPDPGGATVPLELPDGFLFLFVFDFFSTLQRKNPVGLVEAFKRAFAPGEGPALVLKTINARFRPESRERLRHAIGDRPDIVLADATLRPEELAALYVRADAYVSLHRAEGFGLTMAEAMALGKPVVAAGFSGNTDFMTPANSYLVDWELAEVGGEAEHYPADGIWAEPSLEHAAELMREVHEDREGARRRGERAAADIAAALGPEAVGRLARERLIRIAARRAGAPADDGGGWPHSQLPARLHFDLEGREGARGGLRGQARRAVFRTLRPYTSSERALDEVMAESLRRMAIELAAERAAAARSRRRAERRDARVAALEARLEALLPQVRELERAEPRRLREDLDELLGAARALPFTAEPFESFDHPVAGRVQGFRAAGTGAVEPAEAYRAFEDVFRGPRERVSGLVAPYVPLLREHGPVLEIGSGRGELLQALRDAGIEARGVDLDAGMAAAAREQGLDVAEGDGLATLEAARDGSLGAVVSIQVIEHLPREALLRLFELARAKLRPGGLLVAETVNPHAAHALKTFWVDLTHQHPVFPEVALALARHAGFREGFVCHLLGRRHVERDRYVESSYAVVATA